MTHTAACAAPGRASVGTAKRIRGLHGAALRTARPPIPPALVRATGATKLRILLVEDSAEEAALIERALLDGGLDIELRIVSNERELRAALAAVPAHIVVVDWVLPGFSGAKAMAIVRGWDKDLPCIVVSGRLGHELVGHAIRNRAADHVAKRRLETLAPAVVRALAECAAQKNRARHAAELDAMRNTMADSLDAMPDPFVLCSSIRGADGAITDFEVLFANRSATGRMGPEATDLVGRLLGDLPGLPLKTMLFKELVGVVETGRPHTASELQMTVATDGHDPVKLMLDLTVTKFHDGFCVVWRNVTERVSAREALAASDGRLHTAFDATLEGLAVESAVRDKRGRIVDLRMDYANPAIGKVGGMDPTEQVGHTVLELFPGNRDNGLFDEYVRVIETGVPFARDAFRYTDPDAQGGPLDQYLDLRAAKMGDAIVFSVRDVTERVRTGHRLARLDVAINQASEMVAITDASGSIEFANPAYERVTGYSSDELIGSNLMHSGQQAASFYNAMWAALKRGQPWVADFINRRKDGSTYLASGVISPIRDDSGVISGYVSVMHDVTDERAHEEYGLRMAREGALIAETIRRIRTREAPEAIAQAVCEQVVTMQNMATAGLYVFELDGQAAQYGFAAPFDMAEPPRRIAVKATNRLRESADRGPWIQGWRMGNGQAHAHDELYAILGVMMLAYAPVHFGGVPIGFLVVSSVVPNALTDALPALVEFADLIGTMIGPKVADRTEADTVRARIRKDIGTHAFHPVYQPIVDISQGRIVGYEALTRFDDKVPPDSHFIEAEATGMAELLEGATLRAALDGAVALPPDAWLSLNVSPAVLRSDEPMAAIAGATHRQLIVEVTERAPILDYAGLRSDVRRLGPHVRLAVDDAGSGFASLRHILELRAGFVKLDRSLIAGLDHDQAKQALVAGMKHFARSADFFLIAEGVETNAELAALRDLDVRFAQGYLLGRPLPANKLTTKPPLKRIRQPRRPAQAAAIATKGIA